MLVGARRLVRHSLDWAEQNLSSHFADAWRKVEERYMGMSTHVGQSCGTYRTESYHTDTRASRCHLDGRYRMIQLGMSSSSSRLAWIFRLLQVLADVLQPLSTRLEGNRHCF